MQHDKPTDTLLRIGQVLALIPVSRSTWWSWVRSERAPQPIKVGANTTCWRASEVEEFIEQAAARDKGTA